ncbi:MAG: sterol desaturase family protein [Bacteroidetes bacterium]|nr:sterol desaturase family protein [Bacteroidota bacterium]
MNTATTNHSPAYRLWKFLENAVFVLVFVTVLYGLISAFSQSTWTSLMGMGFAQDISEPIENKEFYKSILAVLSILTTFFILVELIVLTYSIWRESPEKSFSEKWSQLVTDVKFKYKSNFLSRAFNEYLSKAVVIFVYLLWMPYFEKFALFKAGNTWYWWLYAYLMWELTYWIWHYAAHRIRLFWCLHAPHHTPSEMNLTVAWVHFFAEGYYTAFIQVPLLMFLGVRPEMVAIILVIDGTWGTFIHAGERAFKNGKFGFLQHLLITPSHHRAHHARNPLYIDTNFCVLLPFWDWLFGTLQPERKEVPLEYGITRPVDTSDWIDFYFGECIGLFNDVKNAKGFKNKLLFCIKPPGWAPESQVKTAAWIRQDFLKGKEQLGETSRDRLIKQFAGSR